VIKVQVISFLNLFLVFPLFEISLYPFSVFPIFNGGIKCTRNDFLSDIDMFQVIYREYLISE